MLYRFSKLFMTHLDAEFKKQNSESLKTLITNQVMFPALPYCIWLTFPKFQGTQVYGTICQSCQYRSETRSEFLELEVSFKVSTYRNFNYYYSPKSCKNNAKLEDCISTSLLPETLSGENQWGLIPQVRTYFTHCLRLDISAQAADRYKTPHVIQNCGNSPLSFTFLLWGLFTTWIRWSGRSPSIQFHSRSLSTWIGFWARQKTDDMQHRRPATITFTSCEASCYIREQALTMDTMKLKFMMHSE